MRIFSYTIISIPTVLVSDIDPCVSSLQVGKILSIQLIGVLFRVYIAFVFEIFEVDIRANRPGMSYTGINSGGASCLVVVEGNGRGYFNVCKVMFGDSARFSRILPESSVD